MCGFNRNTLRQAIGVLTADGLLKRVKGSGTFVSALEPAELRHKLDRILSFGRELLQAGMREHIRLLEK